MTEDEFESWRRAMMASFEPEAYRAYLRQRAEDEQARLVMADRLYEQTGAGGLK